MSVGKYERCHVQGSVRGALMNGDELAKYDSWIWLSFVAD